MTAYYKDEALEGLPLGLEYKNNKIVGTATNESVGRYTIIVSDQAGYNLEKFDLIIKTNEQEKDPPIYQTTLGEDVKLFFEER